METPNRTSLGSADSLTIGSTVAIAVLAGFYGLMIFVIDTFGFVTALTTNTVTVPQPSSLDIAAGASDGLRIVEGSYSTALLTVSGASDAIQALVLSSRAFDTLTHLAVVLAVIMLCVALVRRRPFIRAVVRALVGASFALVIGGMLSSGPLGFATMELALALDRPEFPAAANLDFTAAFIGIGLALVATAFAVGERLQRDTEGLV
jgi:hypothetical protein